MAEQEKPKQSQQQEDEVVGKAYDSRLMRRLIRYLYPYKFAAFVSLAAILIKAGTDVLGPYLTKIAVDRYMTGQTAGKPSWLGSHLSTNAFTGMSDSLANFVTTGKLNFTSLSQSILSDLIKIET